MTYFRASHEHHTLVQQQFEFSLVVHLKMLLELTTSTNSQLIRITYTSTCLSIG